MRTLISAFWIAAPTQIFLSEMPEKSAVEGLNMLWSPIEDKAQSIFECVDSVVNFGSWT